MILESRTMPMKLRYGALFILVFGLSACSGWSTHKSSQSVRKVDGKGFVGRALAESAAAAHKNDIENWCDGQIVQDDKDANFRIEKHNKDGHVEKVMEHKVEAAHKCQ